MLRSFVCPCSSTAWVSRCFFLPSPTAWGYTACLVHHYFKVNQVLSPTLINISAISLPQTREYVPSPRLPFSHLPFFLLNVSRKNSLLDMHSHYFSFLFPASQFYPFITHKYEKQSSCSWENCPQK